MSALESNAAMHGPALGLPLEVPRAGSEVDLSTLFNPPLESGVEFANTLQEHEEQSRVQRALHVGRAALKGAIVGPFRQIKEIGGEIKQAVDDYKAIKQLSRETETSRRHKVGFMALKAWYAAPMPAYQVADDSLTYPLYLQAQDHFNTGTAYGIAAGATLGLAAVMGVGQRAVEKEKASMVGAQTVEDESDNVPLLLDASVNSAPWQVVRKANEPREEGEPIKLVSHRRIAQYAGSYALVNTMLYSVAEKLPMNEWAGFGTMLWGVWAVSGAYREVKQQTSAVEEAVIA